MVHIQQDKKEKAIKLAEQLGNDADTGKIQETAIKLPAMKRGPIAKIWHKVQDLYRAFMSEDTPASVRTLIIGGLLYLVLPFDIIPDAIPIVGLLDDVAVIGYIWKKLYGLAKVGVKVVNKTLPDQIEKEITQAYNQAFSVARDTLEKALHRQFRLTLLNCLINIGFLLIAVLLLSIEGELSLLLASLCVLVLLLRALYAFGKVLPTIHGLCKAWRKKRTIDGAVAQYLRTRYVFIEPVEQMKARIKVLDGIPSLETMVGMQRKALKKSLLLVSVSIIVATALVLVLRFLLIGLGTSYTLFDLLSYPFSQLWSHFLPK
jgi:uncharacterized membrane protein YkvA (DUF1232 family)